MFFHFFGGKSIQILSLFREGGDPRIFVWRLLIILLPVYKEFKLNGLL